MRINSAVGKTCGLTSISALNVCFQLDIEGEEEELGWNKTLISKMKFVQTFMGILSLCMLVSGELYSAMAGMETLLSTQEFIIRTLESYISEAKMRLRELEDLREDYFQLFEKSQRGFQDFISNPVNAFVMLKKLSIDWNQTKRKFYYLSNAADNESIVYPDLEDVSGAAKALLRVQQTYGLDTIDLALGKLDGMDHGLGLSGDDCFELGRQAFHAGYFDYAISWLEEARSKSADDTPAEEESDIAKYLTLSSYEKQKSSLLLFTSSLIQLGYMMSYNSKQPNTTLDNSNNQFTSTTTMFDEAEYRRLCQTRKNQPTKVLPPFLKCSVISPHPYLLLQPVKIEELWMDPKISIYHDVVSDKEIEILKSLALPMLERAEVAEYTGNVGHRVSDTRVTKIAWLLEDDHSLIKKIYRRIEAVTGLSYETAEPFQVANYGLGGHFHLHMDVLPDTEKYFGTGMGNRIATWLTYLSDVTEGGATVFPRLNLTVWPKKGSALFWHNIKSDGVGNILTLHGACPVVIGSKWVTNVWFHERGQEFRLQCGKRPESSLQPVGLYSRD